MAFSYANGLAFLLAAITLRYVVTFIQRARSPLALVPGPWYSKYTSLVFSYHWFRGHAHTYTEKLHRKYGHVVRLGPSDVDFSSITAAKHIHSYRNPFPKSKFYSLLQGKKLEHSVFSTRDFEYHSRHRRLLSAPMSESNLKSMEGAVAARVELAIRRIGEEAKKRAVADVKKWWFFMATDIIGELTFGDSFRMLEVGQETPYIKDLGKLSQVTALRISFPIINSVSFYLPIPFFREAENADTRITRYAEESLQRYRNLEAADPNTKPTLFTKITHIGGEGLTHDELIPDARAYIVAGSDTTAQTMTYLTWAVCKEEKMKKRLVEEVAALPEGYKDDDLKSLPFLNQVISESLRVFAAAPAALPREVPKGGSTIDGYWIPGGIVVSTQAYSMHRDPVIFPDPERFYPSRWEAPTKQMKEAYLPFGAGARTCLGIHLAYMELRYATTQFFRAYPNAKVSTLEGFCDDDMEQVVYFLVSPKNNRCLIETS